MIKTFHRPPRKTVLVTSDLYCLTARLLGVQDVLLHPCFTKEAVIQRAFSL